MQSCSKIFILILYLFQAAYTTQVLNSQCTLSLAHATSAMPRLNHNIKLIVVSATVHSTFEPVSISSHIQYVMPKQTSPASMSTEHHMLRTLQKGQEQLTVNKYDETTQVR